MELVFKTSNYIYREIQAGSTVELLLGAARALLGIYSSTTVPTLTTSQVTQNAKHVGLRTEPNSTQSHQH